MKGFDGIRVVRAPKSLFDDAQSFLRDAGRTGNEGLVLLAGRPEGQDFEISNLLIPNQRGIRSEDGVCVVVDEDEMRRINVHLFSSKLRLIAQIHSHPTEAYHSSMDDEYAIVSTIGGISLVVPDFARRPFSLDECSVYRLESSGRWGELSPENVRELIQLR
jgi:hypothetical protein